MKSIKTRSVNTGCNMCDKWSNMTILPENIPVNSQSDQILMVNLRALFNLHNSASHQGRAELQLL